MGPRGISILERLSARMDDSSDPITVHLIDDAQHGAGRIWETDQTKTLCMNTRAGAVTLFTEPGSTVDAPVLEGPIQYEWIQLLRGDGDNVSAAKRELLRSILRPHILRRTTAKNLPLPAPNPTPRARCMASTCGGSMTWSLLACLRAFPP